MRCLGNALVVGSTVVLALGACLCAQEQRSQAEAITFEENVRPVLKAHCFHCHGESDELAGGLDLRLRRLIAAGGDSGPAVVPGRPEESLLLRRLRAGEMPPEADKQLTPAEIAAVERWIAGGAVTAGPEPAAIGAGMVVTAADREFWSFRPIERPEPPAVRNSDRVRTPIDRFILARLEQVELGFADDAERSTLLRRACFDLLGLPPPLEEQQRFLADDAPDAYERLIDRLLASPHYGERWGRHWLDVAGYADSEGYTDEDAVRPWAFKYRDWVIRAFNADKPFDELIVEQLAGDELLAPPYRNLSADEAEKLIATGFLRMAPDGTASNAVDAGVARNAVISETLKIVSSALLGLTVGCAECHHHRYDPISQEDYYRLRAIFEPAFDWKQWRTPAARLISLYTDADRSRAQEIEAQAQQIDARRLRKQDEYLERTLAAELQKLPEELREPLRQARATPETQRSAEQIALLKKYPSVNVSAGSLYLYDREAADDLQAIADEAAALRATKPKEEFVQALTEVPGRVPETFVFHRGDFEQPREPVDPGELSILSEMLTAADAVPTRSPSLATSGRRLAYARWLTSGRHPLVARALVNRVWLHHFGRGLVETPGDFGRLGAPPSHPQLLDWLAAEFMHNGWRLKPLQRLIMASTVYRQSHRRDSRAIEADPQNRWYAGMSLRRLEAEAIRDAILSVSGKLNDKPFGPPVPVMADRVGQFVLGIENLNAGRPGEVIPLRGEEFRRSVYVQVRRSRPLAVLDTFDSPRMEPNCTARAHSTVAPQSLLLMNNEFVVEHAAHFARRLNAEAGADVPAQIALAWRLAFSREPSEEERHQAGAYLTAQTQHFRGHPPDAAPGGPELAALASLCQMLLAANEFLYVD